MIVWVAGIRIIDVNKIIQFSNWIYKEAYDLWPCIQIFEDIVDILDPEMNMESAEASLADVEEENEESEKDSDSIHSEEQDKELEWVVFEFTMKRLFLTETLKWKQPVALKPIWLVKESD